MRRDSAPAHRVKADLKAISRFFVNPRDRFRVQEHPVAAEPTFFGIDCRRPAMDREKGPR